MVEAVSPDSRPDFVAPDPALWRPVAVKLPLVGLKEIAQRAGLKRTSVVANWRTRYDDFPDTVADLGCGPVFWWPQVEQWLRETGRPVTHKHSGTRPN